MNQIYKLLILGTLSLFLCTNNANSQTVTISSNPTTHNICLGASRTLTAAITGGTAPYTYNWSTGQSGTASIVVAPNTTTTYNVTITDNALPPVSATSNVITITVNPIPDMTVSNDTTVCSGQSVTLTANGATITNYFWIAPSFTPGANITFAPTTTTVASIIGSDGTCSNQKNITVNVNPLPTATISGATSVCQNDPSPSITFTGANGTSPYTFTYNINGGSNTTVVSVGNTATVSVPTGTAGTFVYNLVSVQDNSSTTCSQNQPQSATVTVNPLPTLVVNDPAEVCSPSTVNLTLPAVTAGSTSGLTLTYWTDASATIAYGTPTAATAGTYYIKGTTAAGCIDIQPVVVVVNQQPTITPLVDQAICLGASYAVDATVANGTPGYTYLWTPNTNITPNNTQEDVTLSPVVSNTYTLSVTDSKGCTATDNIAITVNNPPTADAGSPASICQGASTQLDASGSLQAISYLWSANPADASLTGLNNTSATPNVSPVVTTTYTVTVTNACGFNTDNVVVTIYPSVSISLGADKEICNGSSYTIPGNVTGGTSPFGYNWNPILNLSATNIPNPIAAPTTSTTYIVTVTDAHGCSNTDNIAITVNPKPDINAGADGSFCTGGSYPINATITTPGTPGYTYTWLPNNSTLDDISIEDPTANPAITTTYTVTVTDAKGCTDSDNIIVSVNANPIAEAGANTEICENSSHTLSGSASSGTPAYTYTWNDAGAQSHSVTPGVGSTVYTLTVSDSKGCTDSDNVTITVNPLPTADAGAAQTICGGTAASLDGTPGAGTLPYSFLWTATPATTITPNNIEDPSSSPAATTTYTIQVSDAKGCSATDNVIVTVDPAPVITVTGNDPNPCGTLTGDATANVPGLSTDYTYLWNTTATTQTISGLIAGIYSVTVTEIATGCSSIGSVSLSDPAPFAMTLASNDADNTICAGDNITFTATATPANATGYEFYVDGASAQNGPSNTFTPAPVLTNGQIVSVRGYDGTCSAFSSSITITVNPTPNADAGGDKTICSGNSTTLTASGGGTYVWSHLAGATASVTVNPTTETSYTVSVTLNGCVDTDEAIVFVNDKPAVSAGAPQSICAGESANLSASGATSYEWSNGANTQNTTVTPAATATYTVTGTDGNVCSNTSSVIITVNPVPTVVIINPAAVCSPNTVDLTDAAITAGSTPGLTYSYYTDAGATTPYLTPTVATAGTYYIKGETGVFCSDIQMVTVTVNPLPTANAGADQTICEGISTVLGDAPTASGGSAPYSYNWNPATTGGSNPTATPASTITYQLTVTDNNTCTAISDIQVTVIPAPIANAGGNQTICEGSDYLLTNATATNDASISWSSAGDGTFDDNTLEKPTYSPGTNDIAIGSVQLSMTITGNAPCLTDNDFMILTIDPMPTANAGGSQTICSNQTATVSGATSSNGSIAWTEDGAGSITAGATTLTPTYTAAIGDAGNTVTLTMTVTSANSACSVTASYTVIVDPIPTATAGGSQTICANETATVSGANSTNGTIAWTHDGAGNITNGTTLTPTYTPDATDAGNTVTLTMTVTSNNGGCAVTATYTILVDPIPTAMAGGSQTICANGAATLNPGDASSTNGTIAWTHDGAGTLTNETTLTPTYTADATDAGNNVTLTMTVTSNNGGCTVNATYTVTVDPIPTATAGGSQTICANETATVSGANSTNGTIAWTHDGAGNITNGTTLTPTYTPDATDAGNTVTLTMTVTSNNGGCAVTATYTILVDPIPTAMAGGSQTICANGAATLNPGDASSTNGTIAWTHDGAGTLTNETTLTPTYTADATDAGNNVTLTMTVTSNNGGCTVNATYTVTVEPLPTATAGGSSTICSNGVVTLNPGDATATNGTIAWTEDGAGSITAGATTLTPTYTADVTDEGKTVTLTMTVTSNNACGIAIATATYTIIVDTLPTATAGGTTTICSNGTATVNGATATNGTIAWTEDGAGSITSGATTLTPTYTAAAGDAGNTVTLTMTVTSDNAGCSVNATYSITVDPIPTAIAGGSTTICSNSFATLNPGDASATNGSILWTHDGAGSITAGATTLTPTYTADAADAGNIVTLTMTVTSNNGGCTATATYAITVNTLPTAIAGGSTTICSNGTATLNPGDATASNGTIAWTEDGAGSITAGATTLTPTYTAAAGDEGNTVTLTMTVTSNNSCGAATATATYTVIVEGLPTATAGGSTTICSNSTATVSGATATNGTIAWTEDGAGTITAGATTLTPTYTAAAGDEGNTVTLTMTVTSNNSCGAATATATYTITVDPIPTATAGGSTTICSNGAATLNPGDATAANGTISWTENGAGSITAGATTLTPTYTAAAGDAGNTVTLTMTVTSNNTCGSATATATYSVIVENLPTASAGGSTTICANATATVSGATATNGTISWTEDGAGSITAGATTLTPTYTAAAGDAGNTVTLTMTVTSNNSCGAATATANYTVIVDAVPTANAGGSTTICSNTTATVSGATATNGTIAWTENGAGSITAGATTLTPTYTAAAGDAGNTVTLTMTVTSTNSACTATATYSVIVDPLPTANAGGSSTICADATTTVSGATATNGTIAWTEDGAGSITAGATTLTPTYTAAAGDAGNTVTLTMTVTSNNTCGAATATATYTVIIDAVPTANAGGSTTICSNTTATVSGATATNGTIAWTENGAGSITAGANTLTPTYTAAAGDEGNNVTLTMIVTSANAACTATATYTVTVEGLPTATAGGSTTICSNGTTTLNPGDATSTNGIIAWTENGAGSITAGSNTLTPTYTAAAGDEGNTVTLTMTVTSNNTCGAATATATYTVLVNALPTALAGGSTTICVNGSATLNNGDASATNGTIAWTENGGGSITAGANTLTPTYTSDISDAGNTVTLTMTVTSNNACAPQTATASYSILVLPTPTANAGSDVTLCAGTAYTVVGASATNNSSVLWIATGGTGVLTNANTISPTYTPAVGDVNVTLELTSNGNTPCGNTNDQMTISYVSSPTANAGPDLTICANELATLVGTATNFTSVQWTGGAGIFSNSIATTTDYVPNATDPANLTITFTVTGSGACPVAADQMILTINPTPTANAGTDQTICPGTNANLNGTGAGVNGTYTWAGANLSATNIANPIANPTVTNSYTLTVIDANGCSDVDDMIVNTYNVVKPIITPDGPLTYCTAQPINLTLDAGAGFAAYQWKNNAANIIGQIAQTTLVTTIGNYSVQVQDGNGCFTESDIITVQISDPQPVLLADGATTFCENEDVILYFDDPYYTYIWSSGSTTSTIKATESGNYHATITDLYGCVAFSDSLLVTVNPIPDSYFGFADSLLKVDFYNFCNYTTGASNFTWNFGDGTPSINGISPTHNYANPGTYTVTLIATNACGADTFSMDITVVSSTDITENSNIASWNVYPNPTDNQVTIDIQSQIEQDLTIVIRNTIGQSVLSENQHINSNINRTQFDVSNLKQGIYLIEVITNKGMLSKKLLIQR